MLDQIGTSHMTQGNLTNLTSDRFGNPNSALALNGGWTQVPSGIYFDTPEFSISVWVYPQQVGSYARVIDFGNGHGLDNILLTISSGNSLWQPTFDFYSGSNKLVSFISSQILNSDQWNMITITFNETNFRIYLNETLQNGSYQNFTMSSIQRSNCYIGKSNFNDGVSWSNLDDLRIYNKSLTQEEIIELMNQNETSKYIFFISKLILLFNFTLFKHSHNYFKISNSFRWIEWSNRSLANESNLSEIFISSSYIFYTPIEVYSSIELLN